MKDGIVMKGKHVIIPYLLEKQILEQLLSNHIGIENNVTTHVGISILD